MTHLPPAARQLLTQAFARRRRLLFLRRSARITAVVCGLILLLGIALTAGWLTSAAWAAVVLAAIVSLGTIVWLGMAVVTLAGLESDDNDLDLAAAVERSHQPLMDRLNTLVFLRHTHDQQLRAYADQIGRQTLQVLRNQPAVLPFPPQSAMRDGLILAVVLSATAVFYCSFHPWRHLAPVTSGDRLAATSNTPWQIPPFPEEQPEVNPEKPWCDVRISEPGKDLRVTALDRIPLRIEAASNQPLKQVEWFTSVNGSDEIPHPLPATEHPSYAVYEPNLSVPDLAAEAWDVIRYYARATTRDGTIHTSEMYFVEVAPFREELASLGDTERSTAQKDLDHLSSLIERQKEVLRQTHRQAQISSKSSETRPGPLKKLADQQAALQKEASHLAADLANRKQQPDNNVDASLRRAAESLEQAEDALRDTSISRAIQSEEAALGELVATRNALLKSAQSDASRTAQQTAPTEDSSDGPAGSPRTEPMSSDQQAREGQLQAARDFVQQTLLAQRDLERQADPRRTDQFPNLAENQKRLNQSMEEYTRKNPSSFAECQTECADAQSSMNRTAQSLASANQTARQDTGRAADALQQLDNSLEKQVLWNRLAEAHQLRTKIEEQISKLQQSPREGFAPDQAGQLRQQAQETTRRMKTLAEDAPSREYFDDELRAALSDEKLEAITGECHRLGESGRPGEQRKAADRLAQQLRQVARAFDASCPNGSAPGPTQLSPTPSGQDALAQGLRQLQSAARDANRSPGLSPLERVRLAEEGGSNLAAGIASVYGENERTEPLLDDLQQRLKQPESLVDPQLIQELLAAVERLRREKSTSAKNELEPTNRRAIDASRFPPAYGQAIEKYFEKLSEE